MIACDAAQTCLFHSKSAPKKSVCFFTSKLWSAKISLNLSLLSSVYVAVGEARLSCLCIFFIKLLRSTSMAICITKSWYILTVIFSEINSLVSSFFLIKNFSINLSYACICKETLASKVLEDWTFNHFFGNLGLHLESFLFLILYFQFPIIL